MILDSYSNAGPDGRSDGSTASVVYVIDDDESIRTGLSALFRSSGLHVETFGSPREFLAFDRPSVPGCVILDIRLRGENGLVFQQEMVKTGVRVPILFITGHGDVEMSVKAMKAGAIDFFQKPFRDQDLLDAVSQALNRDAERLAVESALADLHASYESLTAREREVMAFVVAGLLNKQIAAAMRLSEITVKTHRGQVMRKLGCRSVADLVRKAEALGVGDESAYKR
ncbi:two component transcriptional regulator, LuxR family [Paraburkholderia caballeronis]|uniref:Two-component response regulator, FixJ family, consists of REC and HTH domains n=1 Tax=Paraburkholderia caballeronis TaxID=416943 RepID=A0A1H7L6T1_9BURK|nr:LuxR family two component transcriptional regulator [Paraburkholderia caballeronis]PXX03687.1 LuxR family two component transcriptional regulator [Paraburkholderia caballeronis]RAK04431.1 LuxR family two component transcriptional regulator [Paraburkholderia caballeronis]SED80428.1 two component transcriptional regulator, LuxR family [Paraburkholderia caballeronis]SEK94753.1 Two-component response regulator, FixJ family, consists of REC and HTH domains [Paraburkholderia caballeronis]